MILLSHKSLTVQATKHRGDHLLHQGTQNNFFLRPGCTQSIALSNLVFTCREDPEHCFSTIPDFAEISVNRQKSVPHLRYSLVTDAIFICWGDVGNCRQCLRQYKFEFSYVGNDHRPTQKSGARRENRSTPDFPDLSGDHPRRSGMSTISSFH